MKTVIAVLLPFGIIASAASAQGLLGERYIDINAGYERFKGSGDSIDGWGAEAAFNFPLLEQAQFGLDLDTGIDYMRGSESGVTFAITQVGALARGFMPIEQAFKPFAGVGVTYTHFKVSGMGFSDSDSSFYIPLEVGIEFMAGPVALTPFFRYSFATESDWDDFWTLGARATYWFDNSWGGTLTVSHSDFDDGFEVLGIRVGLVFAY